MAPRQASPLTLSSPHLVPLDKSLLDPADSSPETTGMATKFHDHTRVLTVGHQVTTGARNCTIKARSMEKENAQNLPVVIPASVHVPVPVVFSTKLSGASSSSQEAKQEHDGSFDEDDDHEDQILQAYLDLRSSKYYGQDNNHLDLTVKQQLMERMSNLEKHQEMQRIKSEQFHQRIQQERQNMSARQQSRLQKVRALEDIISASQSPRCDLTLINEQLTRKLLESNDRSSSALSSASPLAVGEGGGASQIKTWEALLESSQRCASTSESEKLEAQKKVEALSAEVSILKSQVLQLEKENNARADTIHSLREQNQAMAQELRVAHAQKVESENSFQEKISVLSRDRHELIYRLIEMERRVFDLEKTNKVLESSSSECQCKAVHHPESSASDACVDESCGDDVTGSEGKVTVKVLPSNDSDSYQREIALLLQRLQEFEQQREILEMTKEALEESLIEANENRREVENSLAAVTENLEIVRADNTTLSEELAAVKEEADHLSGARNLLLDELDTTTTRLNGVLHHRNQLESENMSLRESRDKNEKELTDNMALFTAQHKSIESVMNHLREVRLLMTDSKESPDVDATVVDEERSSDDKENLTCLEETNAQWLDSALVQMDEMESSLSACLAGLTAKLQPSEANPNEQKEATQKGSWSKFSIKGLFGRKADVAVPSSPVPAGASTSSDGKSSCSEPSESITDGI